MIQNTKKLKKMKLTKNFTKEEFDSKDGAKMPRVVLNNIKELAEQLQFLRDYTGKAITINSAYRSPKHNASIGGVRKSRHVLGMAADITIQDYLPSETYKLIENLITARKMKQGGLGSYTTFTHYDIYFDGTNIRRW